jgi:hypothetical protein
MAAAHVAEWYAGRSACRQQCGTAEEHGLRNWLFMIISYTKASPPTARAEPVILREAIFPPLDWTNSPAHTRGLLLT